MEITEETPYALIPHVLMQNPNDPIIIFKGKFEIRRLGESIEVEEGEIIFEWLPNLDVKFTGSVKGLPHNLPFENAIELLSSLDGLSLFVDGQKFCDCRYVDYDCGYGILPIKIEGEAKERPVFGNKEVPYDKVRFALPNFTYDFLGTRIKYGQESSDFGNGRLVLNDGTYRIYLDKSNDFKERFSRLDKKGGYLTTAFGEIEKDGHSFSDHEMQDIISCLGNFFSLVNGRRCFPILFQGRRGNHTLWTEYSSTPQATHKNTRRWSPWMQGHNLSDLWINFRRAWQAGGSEYLYTAVHWYIEANGGTAFVEGSIIMTQTALELLCNLILFEKRTPPPPNSESKLPAAEKMRKLLLEMKVSSDIPNELARMKDYRLKNPSVTDGPDLFVKVRNALVHSKEGKRKVLTEMSFYVKQEALDLGLWYLELALLYSLNYHSYYSNRIKKRMSMSNRGDLVPWIAVK